MTKLQDLLGDLAKDDHNSQHSYITFDDIKAVHSLTKDNTQPFMVIRAPKGTILEVPNGENEDEEDSGLPYKMKLSSEEEPILVYVVSNENEPKGKGQNSLEK